MTNRSAPTTGRPRRDFAPLAWYAVIQVLLLSVGSVGPFTFGAIFYSLALLGGVATLTIRTVQVRPEPRIAWRLFILAGSVLVAGAVAAPVIYGVTEHVIIRDPVSIVLATVPFHVVGAGLGFLFQAQTGRSAQLLDPLIAACALFLLLWTLWLGESFAPTLVSILIVTLLPLGLLLAATMGVRLILSGGMSDPPVALALLGSAALSASMTSLLITGVASSSLNVTRASSILWATFGAALGAAALHPRFAGPRRRPTNGADETSVVRTIVFALVALVPIVVWASESEHVRGAERRSVAVVTSGLLLLLLVARMGLVSRIAHQRAAELDRRAEALSDAFFKEEDLHRELAFRASHDPLTGLYNRSVLVEHLERVLRHPTGRRSHGVVSIDIDDFKDINDSYGHPVGDQLLVAVGERLRRTSPPRAVVVRLGGDEFAVFLEDADERELLDLARASLDELRAPFRLDGNEFAITVSVGIVTTSRVQPPTPDATLRSVDQALYRAKQRGKNRLEVAR